MNNTNPVKKSKKKGEGVNSGVSEG